MWLALENKSTNLVLKLGNRHPDINPGYDNKTQPLTINLDAPKIISVSEADAKAMRGFFSGNTKFLTVNTNGISAQIQKMLTNLGAQFRDAPLTLLVRLGTEALVDYKHLSETLAAKTTDVSSGRLSVQFAIDRNGAHSSNYQIAQASDKEFTIIDDNSIRIFINDNDFEARGQDLSVWGSTTAFTIPELSQWLAAKPHGLTVRWSTADQPDETNTNL